MIGVLAAYTLFVLVTGVKLLPLLRQACGPAETIGGVVMIAFASAFWPVFYLVILWETD